MPIVMTAQFAPEDQAWANALRREFYPPERNRVPAHITLFHQLPPMLLPELKHSLGTLCRAEPPPFARIDRLLSLGRGVALHVDCLDLDAMRGSIAERLQGMLTPQDQARPRFHITVQNKVTSHVAREALNALADRLHLPRPLAIASLNLWHYRGGPWEAAGAFAFRGRRTSQFKRDPLP